MCPANAAPFLLYVSWTTIIHLSMLYQHGPYKDLLEICLHYQTNLHILIFIPQLFFSINISQLEYETIKQGS